jgi:hypothetical protein
LAYAVAAPSSVPHDPESKPGDVGDLAVRQKFAIGEINDAFDSGALGSSRAFDTIDAAAKEALTVIDPISRRHHVELGGFISGVEGGYSYGRIFVGTSGSLPALMNVPGGSAAGFHTHPSGARYFSINDAKWVNGPTGTRKPLYLIGNGQVKVCGVSSLSCNPIHAEWTGPYDPYNRALQGAIIQ